MLVDKRTSMKNEEKISNSLYAGDKGSFEVFYKKYYKRLYIASYQYTKHAEQSEEIVNDLFLKIWQDASQLRVLHSLDSYLYRSVINCSLNFIKKRKNDLLKQETFNTDFEETDLADEETENLENRLILIEQALEQLPAQCKKVMMMSKYEKIKQQEIADNLNISIKTVKNHLTYGYKKIKLFVDEQTRGIFMLVIGLF